MRESIFHTLGRELVIFVRYGQNSVAKPRVSFQSSWTSVFVSSVGPWNSEQLVRITLLLLFS